jgi:hypothetical protein
MANIIAGLGAQLGLDTTQFQKGIGEAKSSLKELKEYIPEILTAAGFIELTKASIEFANQIAEVAKANDVAVSSVLELTKALEVSGGGVENVSKIYSGFTQRLEAAIQGNAQAQTSFAKLGITLKDLAHLDEQQLFNKTISSLGNMKDSVERNGLAFMTMGKAIKGVDVKGLAEAMDEVRGTTDKYATSIKMANEFTDKLKESSSNLKIVINDAVIPSLATLYDSFTRTGTVLKLVHDFIENMSIGVVVIIKTITTGVSQLFDVLKALGSWAVDFSRLDFSKAGKDLLSGMDEVKKDGQDYLKFFDELKKAISEPPKMPERPDPNRTVQDSAWKQVNQAELLAKQYQNQVNALMQAILAKNQLLDKTKNQQEQEMEINKIFVEQAKALDNIDKAIAGLDKKAPNYDKLKAGFEETKKAIDAITFKSIPDFQNAVKKNQLYQESFEYGWAQAFNQYKESAMTAAQAGQQFFTNSINTMTNALENFAKTGKLDFKGMVNSIIQDLIKLEIKYQEMQLFKSFGITGGSSDPFLSIGSVIGKLFGGGKANGGSVDGNTPYLIGEQGPELFIPQSSGTIIPNNQLRNQSTESTTNVTNNYINAIDTKSFEERLLGSSKAIWAANQYGAKSLATTYGRT